MDLFRIKIRREELGLTQQELADRVGITTRSLSSIENGRTEPHRSTLELLSDALYPGEPKKFEDLIAPPPDYSGLLAELDAADVPGYAISTIRHLLDVDDPEAVSDSLRDISGIFNHFRQYNFDFSPYISQYCRALLSSAGLLPSFRFCEIFWQSIMKHLRALGELAEPAWKQMDEVHSSANQSEQLDALKTAVATAYAMYFDEDDDGRDHCIKILLGASCILTGAKISESDRVTLFRTLIDFTTAFCDTQFRAFGFPRENSKGSSAE